MALRFSPKQARKRSLHSGCVHAPGSNRPTKVRTHLGVGNLSVANPIPNLPFDDVE
eukprot:m.152393 g.152393  ORF g.152393 m.152393 type:complete len:56 (-) comp14320_c0_seq2:64-231(-)